MKAEGKSTTEIIGFLGALRSGAAQPVIDIETPRGIAQAADKGILGELRGDIREFGSSLRDSVIDGAEELNEQADFTATGRQGVGSQFLQGLGTFGRTVGRVGGSAIQGLAKAALPETAERFIGGKIQDVAGSDVVQNTVQSFVEIGDAVLPEDEVTRRNLGAGLGILEGVGTIGGAGILKSVTNQAARKALLEGEELFQNARSRVPEIDPKLPQTDVKGFQKDLLKRTRPLRLSVSDIDPQLESTLQRAVNKQGSEETFRDINKYFQAATNAKTSQRSPMPSAVAAMKAEEAFNLYGKAIGKAVEAKQNILNDVADVVVPTDKISRALNNFQDSIASRFSVRYTPDGELRSVDGGVSKLDASDERIIKNYAQRLSALPADATVKQIDDFVDYAQGILYKQVSPNKFEVASDPVISELRKLTGELNNSVKDTVGNGYAETNARIASLLEKHSELNSMLGFEGDKGASFMKKLFSPSGEQVRRVFLDIEKETGIDLFKEAQLAKFAMDSVGDVRQKSLLKQVDVATQRGTTLDLTDPKSWFNFLREFADLDGQDLANEIVRKTRK